MASSAGPAKEEERWASLCNCVVNFLLEEKYHLTALELLHELLEDGRHDHAFRLRSFFADPQLFPPDLIARANANPAVDTQSLLEEKTSLEEKLALTEYDLRLAQEDLNRLKLDLRKQRESLPSELNAPIDGLVPSVHRGILDERDIKLSLLGPLKDNERKDLNCAVKEYLLFAGYRLATMTFIEEVSDQNLDAWPNSPACVPDALRRYYYQYLSSTSEAAEEKMSILREKEAMSKEIERINAEKESLLKNKELMNGQIGALTKTLEVTQKDLRDKEKMVHSLKQSLDVQRRELNECRAEITTLKMNLESFRSSKKIAIRKSYSQSSLNSDGSVGELKPSDSEVENLQAVNSTNTAEGTLNPINDLQRAVSIENVNGERPDHDAALTSAQENGDKFKYGGLVLQETLENNNNTLVNQEKPVVSSSVDLISVTKLDSPKEIFSHRMATDTIQILSDALPKIVPYVLINHREELLPLIMCAIERHPDATVRDSLTHTLFNLIKRPDEQQRRIIMDACVDLAKKVGEMRTETELLPQCWEQINHNYEERRLLVAQSCGELAEYVRPEIRDSLILSIVQQLVEDSAVVVREAATHNLALLLPLFPNMDKYLKVEDLMFQLVCDPSGVVVESALKKLVPAVIRWGGKLDNILKVLLSDLLTCAQRCPPLSGVDGTAESHLRVLGERERWDIDVLLRMLAELLPFVYQKAVETSPFTSGYPSLSPIQKSYFSTSLLKLYSTDTVDWPSFDWMHASCFPDLIKLSLLLPQKEDSVRRQITKYLLDVTEWYGKDYMEHMMLPVFLLASGDTDSADLSFFSVDIQTKTKGLRPKTPVSERLAVMCVLPLLLSAVLGSPLAREQLAEYLRKVLVTNTGATSLLTRYSSELVNAVRFLCTFTEHHGTVFNVLWEMVVSSNVNLKINAAYLLKVIVPFVDVKVASAHVLPALVTLGSDQNLTVKYASIDAFGAVAQHFKNDMIVDKIRVQMDTFLEDGSHEATISVIRALLVAVPHTTDRLRDYLLSKIFKLSSVPPQGADITRRRERANAFCEAIRALDATEISPTNVKDLLLPAIQNLLKDHDAVDPAHKEALEVIMRERSGAAFDIGKVMGAHLGIASPLTSFFGDGGAKGKKEAGDSHESTSPLPSPQAQPHQEDTRLRRIMRAGLGDMLRGMGKSDEPQ